MSKLPAFIRVFVHLVLLAAALVALPYTLLLCTVQSVVLAAAFAPAAAYAKSTEPAPPILAHAIGWPLRLALALLLLPATAAVPAGPAWAAWALFGESIVAAIAVGLGSVLLHVIGGHWILGSHGIFGLCPPLPQLRPLQLLRGIADAVLDLLAAVCAVLVRAANSRGPGVPTGPLRTPSRTLDPLQIEKVP